MAPPLSYQVAERVAEASQLYHRLVLVVGPARSGKTAGELQAAVGLSHRVHFINAYLNPALAEGLIEMTIPDKPRSPNQRYRLTDKGRALLSAHPRKNP